MTTISKRDPLPLSSIFVHILFETMIFRSFGWTVGTGYSWFCPRSTIFRWLLSRGIAHFCQDFAISGLRLRRIRKEYPEKPDL